MLRVLDIEYLLFGNLHPVIVCFLILIDLYTVAVLFMQLKNLLHDYFLPESGNSSVYALKSMW